MYKNPEKRRHNPWPIWLQPQRCKISQEFSSHEKIWHPYHGTSNWIERMSPTVLWHISQVIVMHTKTSPSWWVQHRSQSETDINQRNKFSRSPVSILANIKTYTTKSSVAVHNAFSIVCACQTSSCWFLLRFWWFSLTFRLSQTFKRFLSKPNEQPKKRERTNVVYKVKYIDRD